MNQKGEISSKIENSLRLATQQLINKQSKASFESIWSIHRQLSNRLNYFLNYFNFCRPLCESFYFSLEQLIKQIQILVYSTEFKKFGHSLPLLSYMVRKYNKMMRIEGKELYSQKLLKRIIKNEQSLRYIQLRVNPIETKSFQFIKSHKFSAFLRKVNENKISLHNSQCICCSQAFIKEGQIYNKNPVFQNIIQIDYKHDFCVDKLQKYFCALCNSGGGVVIIGSQKKQNVLIAKGIRFNCEQQILQKQSVMYEALQNVLPSCQFVIQRIPVHPNLEHFTLQEQIRLICFRILVFPLNSRKMNYFSKVSKNEKINTTSKYEFNRKKLLLISSELDGFYLYCQSKYYSINTKANCHQKILCFRPHKFDFVGQSDQQVNQQSISHYQKQINEEQDELLNQQEQCFDNFWNNKFRYEDDIPKFKYKNTSLVVVPTSNHDRYIEVLVKNLQKRKIEYELSFPFRSSFKHEQSMRSICMLSHQSHVANLQDCLKQLQINKMVKRAIIKIMPVHNSLQIEKLKFTKQKQQIFKKKFNQKFTQNSCKQRNFIIKNQQNPFVYITFEELSQSIYGYIVLQSMRLRPYFVEEGLTYIKKSK